MRHIDEETLVRKMPFTFPSVMDLLRKPKHESAAAMADAPPGALLPKERDCCGAATD